MKLAPAILVAIRAMCAPAIVAAERLGASGQVLAGILGVAVMSDIFDGIVARRLGVATERLRRADTAVDSAFYLAATVALALRAPDVLRRNLAGVGVLAALELSRLILERAKFGRMAAYHMWSAKAWGIALWLGLSEAFLTQEAGPFFRVAVGAGILADLEGLTASLVLSTWQHDVPSLWHAIGIERSIRRTGGASDPASGRDARAVENRASLGSVREPVTDDVVLREVQEGDLPVFFEQQMDPEANDMAAFPARDRDAFMAHWTKILGDQTVTVKTILFGGQVAGNVVSWGQSGERDVGYWVGREFWGKGIATRALSEFLAHDKARPLHARVARHNVASLRVLEKCGFAIRGEGKPSTSPGGEEIEEVILTLDASAREGALRSQPGPEEES
jgi:RimJ/RimL family protein N-acetyltransferase/phosphatidylglycerophosphate synthase